MIRLVIFVAVVFSALVPSAVTADTIVYLPTFPIQHDPHYNHAETTGDVLELLELHARRSDSNLYHDIAYAITHSAYCYDLTTPQPAHLLDRYTCDNPPSEEWAGPLQPYALDGWTHEQAVIGTIGNLEAAYRASRDQRYLHYAYMATYIASCRYGMADLVTPRQEQPLQCEASRIHDW